jgi:hypothetical protein
MIEGKMKYCFKALCMYLALVAYFGVAVAKENDSSSSANRGEQSIKKAKSYDSLLESSRNESKIKLSKKVSSSWPRLNRDFDETEDADDIPNFDVGRNEPKIKLSKKVSSSWPKLNRDFDETEDIDGDVLPRFKDKENINSDNVPSKLDRNESKNKLSKKASSSWSVLSYDFDETEDANDIPNFDDSFSKSDYDDFTAKSTKESSNPFVRLLREEIKEDVKCLTQLLPEAATGQALNSFAEFSGSTEEEVKKSIDDAIKEANAKLEDELNKEHSYQELVEKFKNNKSFTGVLEKYKEAIEMNSNSYSSVTLESSQNGLQTVHTVFFKNETNSAIQNGDASTQNSDTETNDFSNSTAVEFIARDPNSLAFVKKIRDSCHLAYQRKKNRLPEQKNEFKDINDNFRGIVRLEGNRIIVAFPGTVDIKDAVTDLQAINFTTTISKKVKKLIKKMLGDKNNNHSYNIEVHKGFNDEINKFFNNMVKEIEKVNTDEVNEIWFTGHSKGGGEAVLAAYRFFEYLMEKEDNELSKFKGKNRIKLLTFSAPHVVNEAAKSIVHGLLGNHNLICVHMKPDMIPVSSSVVKFFPIGVRVKLGSWNPNITVGRAFKNPKMITNPHSMKNFTDLELSSVVEILKRIDNGKYLPVYDMRGFFEENVTNNELSDSGAEINNNEQALNKKPESNMLRRVASGIFSKASSSQEKKKKESPR